MKEACETLLLHGGAKRDIAKAGRLLAAGEVVAVPTETVYGLAANALDEQAVLRIFEAKGRPQDNPLIVHVSALEQIDPLVTEFPAVARALARRFWPGPMTLVMKKSPRIPDRTSAGLDTVGIRMPAHPVARAIIDAAGVPLAAPSANISGKPSPTTAADVMDDMAGRVAAVVDGGPCAVGVESTVIDVTGGVPRILRPGAITEEMIAAAVGSAATDPAVNRGLAAGEKPKAPGMKYRHYAPKAPIVLFEGPPEATLRALTEQAGQPWDGVLCFEESLPAVRQLCSRRVYSLGYSWDHEAHSRRLFALLRQFDRTRAKRILAQCPRPFGAGAGTVNRLRKAAGFQSVDCRGGKTVIGVTGRSGSGKSVFSAILAEKGALVLDADAIYRELVTNDSEMLAAIGSRFPGVVRSGVLDRRALGALVFSDAQARLDLNAITHGRVGAVIRERIADSDAPLAVLDVPLLFESGIDRLCDVTLAVLVPREVSRKRILSRDDVTPEQAEARLAAQPDDEYYRKHCDLLLQNLGSRADLEEQTRMFFEKYCK